MARVQLNFDLQKKKTLRRMLENDKSNKGSVDKHIKNLVDSINSLNNYYTTSSCSGRIILLTTPKNGSKKDSIFILRSHELVDSKEIINCIRNIKTKEDVWFRQESLIIHIVSRTLDDALSIIKIARGIGLKRGGIFNLGKRIIMEFMSTEKIDLPIIINGKLFVSDEYISALCVVANKKIKHTWSRIKKFDDSLKLLTNVNS